jgi:VAD1 Analog of StAR-related lipid transfer domain
MTAFVIPNAIQVTTRTAKYTFASFITRDTSYDVIHNIWRLSLPHNSDPHQLSQFAVEERSSIRSGATGQSPPLDPDNALVNGGLGTVPKPHRITQCACSKRGEHYSETMMDCSMPGTPGQIHSLMWTSGFIKDFMSVNQKLAGALSLSTRYVLGPLSCPRFTDIQKSDWHPTESGSHLLSRNMTYIKPLNSSIGPKSTKCEITDETVHADFDDYVTTVTTTRTPGVPSGNVFSVKTRTCLTWAGPSLTRVLVTSGVEWTGRSFLKREPLQIPAGTYTDKTSSAMIERGAMEGQRSYHADLELEMRKYILEHKTEFFPEGEPEGVLDAPVELPAPVTSAGEALLLSAEDLLKARQRETEQKGLQWALDTFTGAWNVGSQSARGAIEILVELFETSSRPTLLGLVVIALIISNAWTLMNLKGVKREAMARRKKLGLNEDGGLSGVHPVYGDGRAPDAGADALRVLLEGVMARTASQVVQLPQSAPPAIVDSPRQPTSEEEFRSIQKALAGLEARVASLKRQLGDLKPESLD